MGSSHATHPVKPSETWYYKLVSRNSGYMRSAATDVVKMISAFVPSACLSVAGVSSTAQEVTLTWLPPGDNGGQPIIHYVARSSGGATAMIDNTLLTHTFDAETPGSSRDYFIKAVNSIGASIEVSVTGILVAT